MAVKQKYPEFILTLVCKDRPGIVAAVSTLLAAARCNIEESSQFDDPGTDCFFMRIRFAAPMPMKCASLADLLRPAAEKYAMKWNLSDARDKMRAMILVSKQDHCLNDLLYRWRIGSLPIEITRVISNHPDSRETVAREGVHFDHFPISKATKAEQEARVRGAFKEDKAELIILARYMQILSPEMAVDYRGNIINIHHSFLPGFKGARPYHRAHERGVKIIGATAHYVTPDLDEGPIIEQETERVNHAMSTRDLINAGRDIERRVLARAIRYHAERRVLINGRKTVVFM